MSSINDISNTSEALNSDTVPTSNIDRSGKYKYNPQTPAVPASSAVPRPEKPDNRKTHASNQAKGGSGNHNWGNDSVVDQLATASGADTKVRAESHLDPESGAEEQRARAEAANPNPNALTLEEYEKQGHKV